MMPPKVKRRIGKFSHHDEIVTYFDELDDPIWLDGLRFVAEQSLDGGSIFWTEVWVPPVNSLDEEGCGWQMVTP